MNGTSIARVIQTVTWVAAATVVGCGRNGPVVSRQPATQQELQETVETMTRSAEAWAVRACPEQRAEYASDPGRHPPLASEIDCLRAALATEWCGSNVDHACAEVRERFEEYVSSRCALETAELRTNDLAVGPEVGTGAEDRPTWCERALLVDMHAVLEAHERSAPADVLGLARQRAPGSHFSYGAESYAAFIEAARAPHDGGAEAEPEWRALGEAAERARNEKPRFMDAFCRWWPALAKAAGGSRPCQEKVDLALTGEALLR